MTDEKQEKKEQMGDLISTDTGSSTEQISLDGLDSHNCCPSHASQDSCASQKHKEQYFDIMKENPDFLTKDALRERLFFVEKRQKELCSRLKKELNLYIKSQKNNDWSSDCIISTLIMVKDKIVDSVFLAEERKE